MITRARLWLRDALAVSTRGRTDELHLGETMAWLARAQDAAGGGGVSRGYSLRWQRAHGRRGWLAAYPETTGYIIPTFFEYGATTQAADYRERALRMARWEIGVQMSSGAVQGGVIGFEPSPAVFNTGQVLFGWARAFGSGWPRSEQPTSSPRPRIRTGRGGATAPGTREPA